MSQTGPELVGETSVVFRSAKERPFAERKATMRQLFLERCVGGYAATRCADGVHHESSYSDRRLVRGVSRLLARDAGRGGSRESDPQSVVRANEAGRSIRLGFCRLGRLEVRRRMRVPRRPCRPHGQTSGLLFGASAPKIRLAQTHPVLEPGRYRITAYLRGLDIGIGVWNMTTEFMLRRQVLPTAEERHVRLDAD